MTNMGEMFHIECLNCNEEDYIEDGYSNDDGRITFKVVGPDLVEIKCVSCGATVVVTDV